MRKGENSVFTSEDATLEINRLFEKDSDELEWEPNKNQKFRLVIPPTVYPPREDTDLLARRLTSLGPGRGRKLLEIGCGTGALTILAASLGWQVSACDINPYAVAASRGNLEANMQKATIREGGVGPEKFPYQGQFDLIVWNLPYIPLDQVDSTLGPMEEAALIDTDYKGLALRLLNCVKNNDLLSKLGRILILGRPNSVPSQADFAIRKWDTLEFDDGEKLEINCLWRPYEKSAKNYVEITGSTNDDLLNFDGPVGTHISTSHQTSGRGRRDRTWKSIEQCYAGSWIVEIGKNINPGLIQLSGGLAVLKTVNDKRLNLKWPNDIMFENRKMSGVLVEGRTSNGNTKVVLGIGINLKSTDEILDFEISSLDEIVDLDHKEIDSKLNCNLSSLLESGSDLPPVDFEDIREEVLQHMKDFGSPNYNGKTYEDFGLSKYGELILGENTIDDGEEINWI